MNIRKETIISVGVLGFMLTLTSCITASPNSSNRAVDQSKVVVTTDDKEWNGSFKDQLEKALTKKLGALTQKTTVSNFNKMTSERKTVDGKDYVYLNFYTTDGKMYRTGIEANKINQQQIDKLQTLKAATLIGAIPIQNTTNQYYFQGFEDLKF